MIKLLSFLMILGLICIGSLLVVYIIMIPFMIYYKKQYNKSKHKISDAAVFELIAKANHFLTVEQLAAASSLTREEASHRLSYLAMEGIIGDYKNMDSICMVYQLGEALPESDVLPLDVEGMSAAEIVETVMKYSHDYKITIPELVIVFGVDIEEAKQILKRLKKSGLVKRLWRGVSFIYVVKDPIMKGNPKLEVSRSAAKIELPKYQVPPKEQVKLKIPDADVLRLAIEYKGRLTSTVLCLKLEISMEEAQIKLDDLHEQGVFVMDINEKSALVEYHLRDKNLLA